MKINKPCKISLPYDLKGLVLVCIPEGSGLNRIALINNPINCSSVGSWGSSISKTLDTGSDLQGCVINFI